MKVILKKVYYCEFCKKKHGLSWGAIGLHEKHCTANPKRSCRMCKRDVPPTKEYVKKAKILWRNFKVMRALLEKKGEEYHYEGEDVKKFREDFGGQIIDELECPACSLAVIRQSKCENFILDWNYREAVADFWEEKKKEEEREELYDRESGGVV